VSRWDKIYSLKSDYWRTVVKECNSLLRHERLLMEHFESYSEATCSTYFFWTNSLCTLSIFSSMVDLETSEEDHHLYSSNIDYSFVHSLNLEIIISIEVNHHTIHIVHITLLEIRVYSRCTPKVPTFCLQSIEIKWYVYVLCVI